MECKITDFDRRMLRALHTIDEYHEIYAKQYGMTFMSITVFEYICLLQDQCTQKALCKELHYSKQCVNTIVKRLVKQGYVELREHPADRRAKYIDLTPAGEAFANKVLWPIWDAEEDAMEPFTEEQDENFLTWLEIYTRTFVERLTEKMEAAGENP